VCVVFPGLGLFEQQTVTAHTVEEVSSESQRDFRVVLCRGQEFAEPAERYMKLHTRSDRLKAAATEAWGVPTSLEDVKSVFQKVISRDACPFPWAEASLPIACATLTSQLQKAVASGYLPIKALAQVWSIVV
jgi:hypothetical protein